MELIYKETYATVVTLKVVLEDLSDDLELVFMNMEMIITDDYKQTRQGRDFVFQDAARIRTVKDLNKFIDLAGMDFGIPTAGFGGFEIAIREEGLYLFDFSKGTGAGWYAAFYVYTNEDIEDDFPDGLWDDVAKRRILKFSKSIEEVKQ